MKYALVALALAAAARAQTRDDIPECAIPCIDDAITSETDCETTDFACACANIESIQGAATGCVLSECGAEVALGEVLPAIEALCAAIGDEEPTEAPTEEPTEAPTEAPTEEPTEAPTEEPTAAPLPEPTDEPITPSVTPTVIQPPPTPAPTTPGSPTEEPTTVPTGAAAALGPMGAIAIAAFGLLAL